jgi:hypothetical protein
MVRSLVAACFVLAPLQAQQTPSVRYGVTKSKDTVTVGEAFQIRVRVRAPADADVRFPENPDTAGTVQGRDPRTIEVVDTVQSLDLVAIYRVAAWDVGRQPVTFDDIVVTYQGEDRSVPIEGVSVFVRSVLPADSALRVPKPARPLFETRPFPWWLLALLAAIVAIALGVWWWMRRRRRPRPPVVIVLLTDGVNNRGSIDPRTAARAAAALGIRIYTIGVGTEGMAPVPVGRGLFGLRYEMRPVEIDDALLTEIARLTGGRYFRARDAEALDRITHEIDRLERVPVQTRTYVRFTELYRWPLALALLALAGEMLLSAWRGPLPA